MDVISLSSEHVKSATKTQWLKLLSNWALVTTILAIALLVVFFAGVGFNPADNAFGPEYSELMQAVRAPMMHRLFTTFDSIGWAMMGGALLIVAAVLRNNAPKRSLFISACAIGLVVGVLGGIIRLFGISDLANRFGSATTEQQHSLLPSALFLYEITSSVFIVGDFLAGAGWLMVASVGFYLPGFPRWLAVWFSFAGILSILQGATSALGMFSFLILMVTIIFGVLGLHAAVTVAFWHPSQRLVSAIGED